MLYNAVLVSAVQQSESAICIHISPYTLPFKRELFKETIVSLNEASCLGPIGR